MKNALFLLLSIALFSACSNDDGPDPENPSGQSQLDIPLTTGSYWIYQEYRINHPSGDTTFLTSLDSVYIAGDTLINGKSYAVRMDAAWGNSPSQNRVFVRDSLGYLVNSKGTKLYSSHDFANILHIEYPASSLDSTFKVIYKMAEKDAQVTVPAGTFASSNYKGTVPPNNSINEPGTHYTNSIYAKNIGLIKLTSFYTFDPNSELGKALVRYHIAP